MLDKRMLLVSAATAACALGIGFLMQPSISANHTSAGAEAEINLPVEPVLKIEEIMLTSARQPQIDAMVVRAERREPEALCGMVAQADAAPGAMVALNVSAPCRSGERVTVHHQGMMFTATLDENGGLNMLVPALASTAVFIVEPSSLALAVDHAAGMEPVAAPDGGAVAIAQVADMAQVDRIVLQWSGNSGFEVHAREFGAQYGDAGHVWHGAAGDTGAGQVVQLGDREQLAPRLVEIYSFERGQSNAAGSIQISVEAEITDINCGREITAQTLRLVQGRMQTRDLILAMPDCSSVGDFLVLNNLVENLKIVAK